MRVPAAPRASHFGSSATTRLATPPSTGGKREAREVAALVEAIPLKLEFAHTRFADGEDAARIRRRFAHACAAFGTAVTEEDGRLVSTWR
jgi:hypothetical protein